MLIAILAIMILLLIMAAYMVAVINSIYLAVCLIAKQTERRQAAPSMPAVRCNHLSVTDNHANIFYDFNLPGKN